MEIAKYQFHSWTRKGIAAAIRDPDDLGAGTSAVKERAAISIDVDLNSSPVPKQFELIGPGDIIGLNPDMIVRTAPKNRITSFEPNYLPLCEFYDEDFLWRYTPAAPAGERLRPWIFLLIVKAEEFDRTQRSAPLNSITLKTPDVFPPATETWLWAHVHNDMNLSQSEMTTFVQFVDSLNANMDTDPDQLYCRLLSPRKLDANTAYYAFLIPSFETGRLAGIGAEQTAIDAVNAQKASWSDSGANGEMPVYYEWYFRTGADEDFESLVKKLKPQDMDPKVGIRDMDASAPGFVKADGSVPFPGTKPSILGLEGALKSPSTVSTVFPAPDQPNDFGTELQKIANLPFQTTATDPNADPIISVPLYGNMHAKTSAKDVETLDITKSTWFNDLNRDPRTRVSAGFGTQVVQKNQERYMQQAWLQVEDIIKANRRIKHTLLYMKVANKFTQATFTKLSPATLLSIGKPVLSRIMGSPTTIYQQIKESQLPTAVFTGTFRRMAAPNRRLAKLSSPARKMALDAVVTGLNTGKMTAAPAKIVPAGALNLQDIAGRLSTLPTTPGVDNSTVVAQISDPKIQLSGLAAIQPKNTFALVLSDETQAPVPVVAPAGTDNPEAANYRKALTDLSTRLAVKAPEMTAVAFDINNAVVKVSAGIDPIRTFPKRLSALVKFPDISLEDPANVYAAMAYPDIAEPTYKALSDISSELLLPNLQLIPDNCISLLNTNPKFIESYMVGLNHEMGRELLWREYPTDQRGSYFRQFWDVNGIIAPTAGQTPAQQAAASKDITAIDTWGPASALGSHNNRGTQDQTQLVLVIRGELLNKYPVIISAQKAIPDPNDPNGSIINTSLSDTDFPTYVKFPMYKADVQPDIKFFGFDLTADEALGKVASPGFSDTLGWYFVLMQVPGTPTFGMDISFSQGDGPLSWDDLSWDKLPAGTKFIQGSVAPQINPPGSVWGADAASMADILFQQPVMVAIHAKQMLANLSL